MLTARMSFVQIVSLEKDFEKTIDMLGDYGWLEIKRNIEEKEKFNDITEKIDEIENLIYEITEFLNFERSENKKGLIDLNEIKEYFLKLNNQIVEKKEKLKILNEKKTELTQGLLEIDKFKSLKLTKNELDKLNFIYFTIGSLLNKDLEKVMTAMKGRLVYIELDKDFYLFFTSKKGRWTLESELKKVNFKEKEIPFENEILPNEVFSKISDEMKSIDDEIKKINSFKENLYEKEKNEIIKYILSFNLQKVYLSIYKSIEHSSATCIIEGWIPTRKLKELKNTLQEKLENRISIVSFDPEEIEDVKNGKLKVPVIMNNNFLFKPFENLVFNYGVPVYGSVDPTKFLAVTFLILFGFMFGDVGQGFVIFLIGLFLTLFGKEKIKKISPIVIMCGLSSIIFGYLYGSIFCFEHAAIFRIINFNLFKLNRAYIIDTSAYNILNVAVITIGLGLIINLSGIFFNVINNFIIKKTGEALFSRNGIAGFLFLLTIFFLYITLVFFKIKLNPLIIKISIIVICSAVLLILLKIPIYNIITNKRPLFHGGVGFWLLHTLVELIEIILVTMSNNLSFVRVAFFAVTHGLLSMVFFRISELLGPFGIIILILGNAIIIAIEGLIVTIQTLRLEYYEFFSKFFTKKGEKFMPFKIEKSRE